MNKKEQFNEFRFAGLDYKSISNKYYTMKRFNDEEDKIVVKVSENQIIETKYGYALILNQNHVVFLKNWQVSKNYYGVEVLLTKQYFIVKEFGDFAFFNNDENLKFETWLNIAKEQQAYKLETESTTKTNEVKWLKEN